MLERNPNAQPEIYSLDVTFKGLKAWIHKDNEASIKLHEKCGWEYVDGEIKMDLNGKKIKHLLYQFPKS